MDGGIISLPRVKKSIQDQQFWLSGFYSRERYVRSGVVAEREKGFPFSANNLTNGIIIHFGSPLIVSDNPIN